MTISRTPLGVPLDGKTFHVIGDVHAGAIQQWRMDAIVDDYRRNQFRPVVTHMQIGDNCENGYESENVTFAAFKSSLKTTTGLPFYQSMGNHDGFQQTEQQWASRFDYQAQNYVVDFDNVRMVVLAASRVGGVGLAAHGTLTNADLTWLGSAFSGTVNPCILMTHYPCYNTCLGGAAEFQSIDSGFWLAGLATPASSADVLSVIASNANCKAWISGHTHSRLTVPGFITPVTTGAVTFAHINCSSPFYAGYNMETFYTENEVVSLFITWYASASKVEIRIRDHGAGQWVAPIGGNPVVSVTVS